jgi:hypothetical protein
VEIARRLGLITTARKKLNHKLMWVALATLLSGCGGGAGGDIEDAPASESGETTSFNDLALINDDLRSSSARLLTEQGVAIDLPPSGTATFVGTASFSENARPQILGGALMEANFSDNSLSGALSGFRAQDGTEFDGTLILTKGSISRVDSSVVADIDGRLTSSSPAALTVDVVGGFNGRFIGDNHGYLRGDTSATWITNINTATEETRTMIGEITAGKQF